MPQWLIEAIIVFTFGPPLLFGLVLLLLAGTYMQVCEKEEEGNGSTEKLHA